MINKTLPFVFLCLTKPTLSQDMDSLHSILLEPVIDTSEYVKTQLYYSAKSFGQDRYISDSVLTAAIELLTKVDNPDLYVRSELMKTNRMRNGELKFNSYKRLDIVANLFGLQPQIRITIKQKYARKLYHLGRYAEAVTVGKEAASLAKEDNNAALGNILIFIGNVLSHQEDHYGAMKHLLEALNTKGNHHAKAYSAIPNVCRKLEDWDNLLHYGEIGLRHAIQHNRYKDRVFSLMQLGYANMMLGHYEKARTYTNEAWEISVDRRIKSRLGILATTMIKIELLDGNIDAALTHEDKLSISKRVVAFPSANSHLGMAYLQKGDTQKAINYCQKALENIGKNLEQPYDEALYKMEAFGCLSEAYQSLGQYQNAYEAKEKYLDAKEIVEGKESILKISKALNQQELGQQSQFHKLEQEQHIALHNERINRYRISGFLGLMLLGLGAFTVQQLRKRNRKIDDQNKIIKKALKEKDLLLREIHHRVKNNLQLVSSLLTMQGRSINDSLALEAINEGKSRVRSMALIHQGLYHKENLTGINIKDYLEKLTQELFSTYRIDKNLVQLDLNIEDMELDIDVLVPLGLIINELISNALKYAFPDGRKGRLLVQLKSVDNAMKLNIKDNGVGYTLEDLGDSSFGNTLVKALTQQLEGELTTKSNNGTEIEISFNA